jgi:prepilin-type N-terminal cleavage/methylation domain-containing protein
MQRGYTLIELLVSVGIIVMMLSVSLPAYSQFQRKQNLETGAHILRDAFLDVQNYSYAPRSDSVGEKPAGVDWYRLTIAEGSGLFKIEEKLNSQDPLDPNASPSGQWLTLKQGSLPTNVTVCSIVEPAAKSLLNGDNTNQGVIYSISQLGKIISPANNFTLRIGYPGGDAKELTVSTETGQVAISELPKQC